MNKVISIRGATTLKENTKQEIIDQTLTLIKAIIKANGLTSDDITIVNCIISSTLDIDEFYPAAAITESGLLTGVPLFSACEPNIKNSIPLCIRVMITIASKEDFIAKHIYLNEAQRLKINAK